MQHYADGPQGCAAPILMRFARKTAAEGCENGATEACVGRQRPFSWYPGARFRKTRRQSARLVEAHAVVSEESRETPWKHSNTELKHPAPALGKRTKDFCPFLWGAPRLKPDCVGFHPFL